MLEKIEHVKKFFDDENNFELLDRTIRAEISTEAASVVNNYDKIIKDNSDLKLGIVGRVKAGKSSFLNSLLFNGRDVLPKAATPMTAALTKISYSESEKNEAKVFFYSKGEWKQIERLSDECKKLFEEEYKRELEESERPKFKLSLKQQNISEEGCTPPNSKKKLTLESVRKRVLSDPNLLSEQHRASLELFEMAEASGLDVQKFLGQDKIISGDPTQNTADFMKSLSEYVGAEGKYTPIVSHIELKVNDKNLKDFVVVDTPGLNDPVTSRSERTNTFLKECHAVLLLSSVTQFLNTSDADLIRLKFEDAGISKGFIIGTMMDIGVRELNQKSKSFQRDYKRSKRNYIQRAGEFFDELRKNGAAINVEQESNPEFVSSFMYQIARKKENNIPLNDAEEDLIYWCKKLYPEDADEIFNDFEVCNLFSGFDSVRENIIAPIREKSKEIIAEKIAKFEASTRSAFLRRLEDANIDAENRLSQIKSNDKDSLRERYNACRECLKNSRYDVKNIFDETIINADRIINRLKIDIHNLMSEHKHLNIITDVDTREYSTGLIFKEYHHEIIRTRRASASNASGNIDSFAGEAERLVENELVDLIDRETIIKRVKHAIEGAFDAMGKKSGSEIIAPLNNALSGLTIRKIDFSKAKNAKDVIYNQFSNDVIDSDIAKLERVQDEQLHKVLSDIEKELDEISSNIKNMMNEKSGTFIDDVEKSLDESLKEIEMQLKDRENFIRRYEKFIKGITELKQELSKS